MELISYIYQINMKTLPTKRWDALTNNTSCKICNSGFENESNSMINKKPFGIPKGFSAPQVGLEPTTP
ncbi:MAG TPA: hypothetical protein DCG75_02225 [Bacteroidales bacterium]|nr:hypothetical protein [Bacteroidales bacterium]